MGQMRALAARGYVAASINYRRVPIIEFGVLSTREPPKVGAEDSRCAVRSMRKMAKEWGLDTSRIALTGNSAGAINALYHSFAKKEQSEGSGGHSKYSSAINSVVSFSGSLWDRCLCKSYDNKTYAPSGCIINGEDDTNEMSSGDVPVAFVHGTADVTVPYKNCLAAVDRAKSTGVQNLLVSIPDAGHVPYEDFLSTSKPFLHQWTSFLAASLNTAQAECPKGGDVLV